jgi:hypothetical protein
LLALAVCAAAIRQKVNAAPSLETRIDRFSSQQQAKTLRKTQQAALLLSGHRPASSLSPARKNLNF